MLSNLSQHIYLTRDCADLNFPQYLEKIKDPIALDVIKERLDDENNDQYSSVRSFLADLRKMFRNCFLFNSRESEIYRHAKKLEEKLDQLLQMWLPEFAFDPLTDVAEPSSKSNKRYAGGQFCCPRLASKNPFSGPHHLSLDQVKRRREARERENVERRRNIWIVMIRAIPTAMLPEVNING